MQGADDQSDFEEYTNTDSGSRLGEEDFAESEDIRSTWTDNLEISDYVVLNPHWLLDAMKGILTHKLDRDVKTLRYVYLVNVVVE